MYIFVFLIVAFLAITFSYFAYRLLVSEKFKDFLDNFGDDNIDNRINDVIHKRDSIKEEISSEEERVKKMKIKSRKL